MNNTIFSETQKFRQPWVWLVLCGCAIISLANVFMPAFMHQASLGAGALITVGILPLVVIVLFLLLRLETQIDASGITYRFFPVHRHMKKILWDEIAEASVRKYRPLAEYGGWGIRYGTKKNGRAVNVSGNMGLQLVFKDGKKLLIGTQKADEITVLLKELGKSGS